MKSIIIAATTLALLGAVHASPQENRTTCAFGMRLDRAACARLEAVQPHGHAGGWMRDTRSSSTLLYASDPFLATVEIETVNANGFTRTGSLSIANGLPFGMTVDRKQNLYVAAAVFNTGVPSVQVFPRGSTTPSKTYTDGLTGPIDVAVDRQGTVYVSNLADPKGGGCLQGGAGGSIIEYAKGSMKPTRTITGFPGCPSAVAIDAKSNLYMTYAYYPSSGFVQSDVIEYKYGSTKGKALGLKVPGGPFLGGLGFDAKGNLLVENDQDDATLNQLLTFAPGSTSPSNTIQYGGTGWASFHYFALDGTRYFAPAYIAENLSFQPITAAAFDYPSGRQLFVQTTPLSYIYGVAISPGE